MSAQVTQKEAADLGAWIDAVMAGSKAAPPTVATTIRPIVEPPEIADALVVIAVRVTCTECGMEHISSSNVLRRIPRKDGSVFYEPITGTSDVGLLPHIVEWASESIAVCWRCFDLVERLIDPTANLALAPTVVEVVPQEVVYLSERKAGGDTAQLRPKLTPTPPPLVDAADDLEVLLTPKEQLA